MELSDFKVQVVTIDEIVPHPNADRLLIAKVLGWQSIIPKGKFNVGDKAVYIPVDSILPPELEAKLFGADAKIKLTKGRVKAIKIRSFISQGMIESLDNVGMPKAKLGEDVSKDLRIVKYEPPVPEFQKPGQAGPASKKKINPFFKVYSKFPRIENAPMMFQPEDDIVVTEKIHGTNFRAGWVPFVANTFWRKVKAWLRLAPKWQFVYGSHYVQLNDKFLYDGYYDKNFYAEIVRKYSLAERLPKGAVIYGEIYGSSIQKGYNYGLPTTRELVVFDIQTLNNQEKTTIIKDKTEMVYVGNEQFQAMVRDLNLPTCPEVFRGKFKDCNVELLKQGPSVLCPEQKVREGIVVKSLIEHPVVRKVAKIINPEYLLGDNTDFH